MRPLTIAAIVGLILLLSPSNVWAHEDAWRAGWRNMFLCLILVPVGMSCVGLVCAFFLSRSNWVLVLLSALGGVIGAACVPSLIGARGFWMPFLPLGIAAAFTGALLGLLAMLAKAIVRSSKARQNEPAPPPGNGQSDE